MRWRSRTTLAAAGAAFAVAAGGGGALAAGGLGGGPGPGPGGPPGSTAVASYLGLTADDLFAQLQSGRTLAQIATAQGKSVAGLEDVMYADAKTHLDQAVADGKLTAAQEQTMLADLKSHLDDIVNRTGRPHGGPGLVVGGPPFGAAAASYLGLTANELRTQLQSGKTLAQIAAAQNRSLDGLKAAILAEAKSHLDQAVADGKLTADQAKTMLAELTSHLDDIVNRTGPPQKP
jgi:polyhydroxyalkanoate synthesis regulator phasin